MPKETLADPSHVTIVNIFTRLPQLFPTLNVAVSLLISLVLSLWLPRSKF